MHTPLQSVRNHFARAAVLGLALLFVACGAQAQESTGPSSSDESAQGSQSSSGVAAEPVNASDLKPSIDCEVTEFFLDHYVPSGDPEWQPPSRMNCFISARGGDPDYDSELFLDGLPVRRSMGWKGNGVDVYPPPMPPGTHRMELRVTDAAGVQASTIEQIVWSWSNAERIDVKLSAQAAGSVPPESGSIDFSASWSLIPIERQLSSSDELVDLVMSALKDNFTIDWEFADGGSSTDTSISREGPSEVEHSFQRPGTYRVVVTVTDLTFGRTGTANTTVVIEEDAESQVATAVPASGWVLTETIVEPQVEDGDSSKQGAFQIGGSFRQFVAGYATKTEGDNQQLAIFEFCNPGLIVIGDAQCSPHARNILGRQSLRLYNLDG